MNIHVVKVFNRIFSRNFSGTFRDVELNKRHICIHVNKMAYPNISGTAKDTKMKVSGNDERDMELNQKTLCLSRSISEEQGIKLKLPWDIEWSPEINQNILCIHILLKR